MATWAASKNKHVSKTLFPLHPHMMQFKFSSALTVLCCTQIIFSLAYNGEKIINGNFAIIASAFSFQFNISLLPTTQKFNFLFFSEICLFFELLF
jgi:hypothetical protein